MSVINSAAEFDVLVNDDVIMNQMSKFKYLEVQLDKIVLEETGVKQRI